MENSTGQVAGQQALITVFDLTSASNSLVNKELSLIKTSINLTKSYCNLCPESKKKSLVYRALKKFLKNDIFLSNEDLAENIVSEALLLLKQASIKYFEIKKEINFEQFAVVYISENIKSFLTKNNGQNSSDKNELIHSAIRIIKKNSNSPRLSYSEAVHLAKHFNLCSKNGYKKIWELESLHFEKKPLWQKFENEEGLSEEICIADKLNISLYDNTNLKTIYNPEYLLEEKEKNKKIEYHQKKILINFEKTLTNKKEKIIFSKRIFNSELKIYKLKEISAILNISIQRINKIEKNLRSKLKKIYSVENKKFEDIK